MSMEKVTFKEGVIATIVMLGAIAVLASLDRGSSSSDSAKTDNQDQATMASVQCKDFVENRLKAPSTADFPWLPDHIYKIGDKAWRVESHVDAQNSFGAKLRGNYTCEVMWNGQDSADRNNWTLVNLQFDEQ